MTRRRLILAAIPCLLAAAGGLALAQPGWPGHGDRQSPLDGLPADRAGVPDWKVDERFKNDVFTFVRVEYDSGYGGGGGGGGWGWGGGLGDRLARQRPELLLPPPAADVAEGQPRPDLAAADRRAAVRLPVPLHDRAGRAWSSPRRRSWRCAATCSTAAS